MTARIELQPHDLWIGVFWKRYRLAATWRYDLWLCIVPVLPVHLRWHRPATGPTSDNQPGDIG